MPPSTEEGWAQWSGHCLLVLAVWRNCCSQSRIRRYLYELSETGLATLRLDKSPRSYALVLWSTVQIGNQAPALGALAIFTVYIG